MKSLTEPTKKQIKTLKKEIVKNTAINIGYYNNITKEYTAWEIAETIKKINEEHPINYENKRIPEIENIIITELIKNTSYSKFKKYVAKYFLPYSSLTE